MDNVVQLPGTVQTSPHDPVPDAPVVVAGEILSIIEYKTLIGRKLLDVAEKKLGLEAGLHLIWGDLDRLVRDGYRNG